MKKMIVLMLAVLFGTASIASAATILVVSDQPVVGGLEAPLVSSLQGLGYTVDTAGMDGTMRNSNGGPTSPANAAIIDAADLVLMTRATNSTEYGKDADGWNAVTKPMILMNGFILRDTRFGWMVNTNIQWPSPANGTDLVITNPAHPFVAGMTDPTPVLDFSSLGGSPASNDQLPELVTDLLPEAEVAATLGSGPGARQYAFSIPAGTMTSIDASHPGGASSGPLAGDRAFIGAWAYPGGDSADYGSPVMTAGHETLLANAISTMLIPEPSTSLLLMLGAAVFGLARRRQD